jgi:hypothetical protein
MASPVLFISLILDAQQKYTGKIFMPFLRSIIRFRGINMACLCNFCTKSVIYFGFTNKLPLSLPYKYKTDT